MADTKWTNLNGGDWHTAANWDNGVPDQTKRAIVDGASFNANGKSITLSALAECAGMDLSGSTQLFTIQSSVYELHLYGDYNGSTNCTFAMTGTAYVKSKATMTLTTNGQTSAWNRWYIDWVGITVTNGDDCNLGATNVYHVNGTLNTNDKAITTTLSHTFGAGTKTLNLGSSIFTVSSFNPTDTAFTMNAGTSTIVCNGNYFYGRGNVYYNVIFNGNKVGVNTGNGTFNDFTINGLAAISAELVIENGVIGTINGILTINGASSDKFKLLIRSNNIGIARTITVNGSIVATNCDFQDITLAGTASRDFSAQTDIGDAGGCSGITFPAAIDCYFKHTSGAASVSNVAKWVTTDGGSTQARVPLLQDRAWFTANSFTGASTVTMDCPRIGSVDMSAVTVAMGWTLGNAISCYGNYILGNYIIMSGNQILNLSGRGSFNFNSYGKAVFYFAINSPGANYINLSNITTSVNSGYSFEIINGTFDFNDFDFSGNAINITGASAISYLGNGFINLTRATTGSALNIGPTSTVYPEGSTIKFNPASGSNNITFMGGGKSFNRVIFSGAHTGNFIVTFSNTFAHLEVEPGRKLQVTAVTTQTVANFVANGKVASRITLSSTTTSPFNLVLSGTKYHQTHYLDVQNCNATPNKLYSRGGVDGGGNNGIRFRSFVKKPLFMQAG